MAPQRSSPSSPSAKPSSMKSSSSSILHTLRALYQRAARAFLQRNTSETQSLIDAAFQILTPPVSPQPDYLSSQRKKWDILRITLETTLYTSPGVNAELAQATSPRSPRSPRSPVKSPPPSAGHNLRSNLLLSPPSLLATLHTRSLRLFTPPSHKPSPEFLPAQILVSLVLASLKLECPQVGRIMAEEWLTRRGPPDSVPLATLTAAQDDGYAKVIDVYCLHILPRLGEWDYATEFLKYESELPPDRRAQIGDSLKRLHAQSQVPSSPPPPYRTKASPSTETENAEHRPASRASTTSSTSTYTAVPPTPRPDKAVPTISELKSRSKHSRGKSRSFQNGSINGSTDTNLKAGSNISRPLSRASTEKTAKAKSPNPTNLAHVMDHLASSSNFADDRNKAISHAMTSQSLSEQLRCYWAMLKVNFMPRLRANLPFVICVILPLLLLVSRLQRKPTPKQTKAAKGRSAAELRRKLGADQKRGTLGTLWAFAWKAISDTVVMAGKGLV
ncbi:hypothetical protein FRB99_008223 [Tulasnella sp. 403]|nr:hypothetical protein FRB99_008223 [Tulasnella sp. 403]